MRRWHCWGRMCKDWELEANLVLCPRLCVVLILEWTGSGRTSHHQTHTYHWTLSNFPHSLTKLSNFCVIGPANWRATNFLAARREILLTPASPPLSATVNLNFPFHFGALPLHRVEPSEQKYNPPKPPQGAGPLFHTSLLLGLLPYTLAIHPSSCTHGCWFTLAYFV
jgi:hypothetical protein